MSGVSVYPSRDSIEKMSIHEQCRLAEEISSREYDAKALEFASTVSEVDAVRANEEYLAVVDARKAVEAANLKRAIAASIADAPAPQEKKVSADVSKDAILAALMEQGYSDAEIAAVTDGAYEITKVSKVTKDVKDQKVAVGPGSRYEQIAGIRIEIRTIGGMLCVITWYPDGSSDRAGTELYSPDENPIAMISRGHLSDRSPWCFLISWWIGNAPFFIALGIMSPYALMVYLTAAGFEPVKGRMYEDETIIPIAKMFGVSIRVNITDIAGEYRILNPECAKMHQVDLSIQGRHYVPHKC